MVSIRFEWYLQGNVVGPISLHKPLSIVACLFNPPFLVETSWDRAACNGHYSTFEGDKGGGALDKCGRLFNFQGRPLEGFTETKAHDEDRVLVGCLKVKLISARPRG